jgi:hypothetical protein
MQSHSFGLSRCRLDGSDSLSVQILFVEWQHSSAKQVNAGTAIHGTFEGLQLVNLSFRLSVAPRFKHGIANGLDILPRQRDSTLGSSSSSSSLLKKVFGPRLHATLIRRTEGG